VKGPLPFFILGTGDLPRRPPPKSPRAPPNVCVVWGGGSCPFSFWENGNLLPKIPPQKPQNPGNFLSGGGSCHFSFWEPDHPPRRGGFRPKAPEPTVVGASDFLGRGRGRDRKDAYSHGRIVEVFGVLRVKSAGGCGIAGSSHERGTSSWTAPNEAPTPPPCSPPRRVDA